MIAALLLLATSALAQVRISSPTWDSSRIDALNVSVNSLLTGKAKVTGSPIYLNGLTIGYNQNISVANIDGSVSTQTVASSLFAGTIVAFGGETVPSGWLECNGASYAQTDYPTLYTRIGCSWGCADGSHFNVPDLRGVFLRGWNHSASTDVYKGDEDSVSRSTGAVGGNSGDNVGSYQNDIFRAHTHTGIPGGGGGNNGPGSAGLTGKTGSTGGNETRPKNAYVQYIIKSNDSIGMGGGGAGATTAASTVSVTSPITGNGSSSNPLALNTSVTLQGNSFNGVSQLVETDSSGKMPSIDGSKLTGIPSTGSIVGVYVLKSGDSMSGGLELIASSITLSGSSGVFSGASSVTASAFFGDGSHLTGTGGASVTSGSGTLNHLSKWTDTSVLGDSLLTDDGTNITIDSKFVSNGHGGSLDLAAGGGDLSGVGGDVTIRSGSAVNGTPGNVTIKGGVGNGYSGQVMLCSAASGCGSGGRIVIDAYGNVGISTSSTGGLYISSAGWASSASTITALSFFGDGSHLTGVTSVSGSSTVSANASMYGDGSSSNPLGVLSSSVAVLSSGLVLNSEIDASSITKQGNAFNGSNQLVRLSGSGGITLPSNGAITLSGSSGLLSASGSSVTASAFFGDGSHLSGPVASGRVDFSTITTALQSKLSSGAIPSGFVDLSTVTTAISVRASSGTNSDIFNFMGTGNSLTFSTSVVIESTLTVQGNAFSVGGSSFVVTAGNVGIGTANPSSSLEVQKSVGSYVIIASSAPSGKSPSFVLNTLNSNSASRNWALISEQLVNGDFGIYQSNSKGANPLTGTAAIYLDASRNVGIGTTSPGSMIHVKGTVPVLTIQDGSASAAAAISSITATDSNGIGRWSIGGDGAGALGIYNHGGATTANLYLGAADLKTMTLDINGRIGIGTTSPATKLHLSSGTFTVDGNVSPSIDANDAVGIGTFTTSQVQAKTPARTGQLIFNTTLSKVCVSTGTAVQGYARVDTGATCQ